MAQISSVVASVTQGVNLGVAKPKIDIDKTLSEAFAGTDDALLKAAQASHCVFRTKMTEVSGTT